MTELSAVSPLLRGRGTSDVPIPQIHVRSRARARAKHTRSPGVRFFLV